MGVERRIPADETRGRPSPAAEPRLPDPHFWRDRRVFLTGHTGFKGAWLALWLHRLGAQVVGFALPQPDERALYHRAGVERTLTSWTGDVREADRVREAVADARPEIVIHMAAQALVRPSFRHPLATYATNVMGTAHVLEAARHVEGVRVAISVTSDKCYENLETGRPFVETDPMGGSDPYSSSKGAAELVTAAYRRSFAPDDRAEADRLAIASVRAGNVIGGGDWAQDRLVVDVVSSLLEGTRPVLRHPHAVRPWQFVLEPLAGYLLVAEQAHADPGRYADGWNFAPDEADCQPVGHVVERIAKAWGVPSEWRLDAGPAVHEAQLLLLDAAKARRELGWRPRLHLDAAIDWTVAWYRAFERGEDLLDISLAQIDEYAALPSSA